MQTSQRHALCLGETVLLLCLGVKICYHLIIKLEDCTVSILLDGSQTDTMPNGSM